MQYTSEVKRAILLIVLLKSPWKRILTLIRVKSHLSLKGSTTTNEKPEDMENSSKWEVLYIRNLTPSPEDSTLLTKRILDSPATYPLVSPSTTVTITLQPPSGTPYYPKDES